MARNQVQFQKGISLPEFLKHYGQEKQFQIAMDKLRWPDGLNVQSADILDTANSYVDYISAIVVVTKHP
jgi:hypothetical protein